MCEGEWKHKGRKQLKMLWISSSGETKRIYIDPKASTRSDTALLQTPQCAVLGAERFVQSDDDDNGANATGIRAFRFSSFMYTNYMFVLLYLCVSTTAAAFSAKQNLDDMTTATTVEEFALFMNNVITGEVFFVRFVCLFVCLRVASIMFRTWDFEHFTAHSAQHSTYAHSLEPIINSRM